MDPTSSEVPVVPAQKIDVFITPDNRVAIKAEGGGTIVVPADKAHILARWIRAAKGEAIRRREAERREA